MNWYTVIPCDNTVPDPLVADRGDLVGIEEYELRAGRPVKNWGPSSWVGASTPDNDGDPDDVLQTYLGVPIYSARLRRTLEASGIDGIQYLPIHVRLADGTEVPEFAIANLVDLVPALAVEQSKLTRYEQDYFLEERRGRIAVLIRPVLSAKALLGHDIIRLTDYRVPIFVSPLFKQVFEGGGFTGYSFKPVETI